LQANERELAASVIERDEVISVIGRVKAVHPNRPYIKIVAEIFGRLTPVILKFSEVEKAPPHNASRHTP
jgi:hypothetical protein